MNIFNISRNDDALSNLTIISFGLFPILPNSIKGLPVVILVLNAILIFFKTGVFENKTLLRKRFLYALLMMSIYICYLFSGFYSENLSALGQKLETSLSLFIVPLCFIFLKNNIRNIDYFKITFVFSTIIFIAFFWSYIILETNVISLALINTEMLRNKIDVIPLISLHTIYASMIFGIAIFLLLSLWGKINKYLFLPIFVVLLFNILVLASKMAIVSLFIVIGYFAFKRVHKNYFKIIVIFLITIIAIASVFYIPNLRHRFNEIVRPNTYEEVIIWNSTSIRKGIYECSVTLLKKQWLFGYGIGDVQDSLNSCYEIKSDVLLTGNYNSHNQYLSIWLGTGIFGILVSLFVLGYNINLALRFNDVLFQVIIIFFALNFLTENLLQRQTGVILFSLLINLFGWNNFNRLSLIDLEKDE